MTLYEKQDVDLLKDIVPVASIDNDAFAVVVVAGELFRMMSGIQVTHVPYRGAPAANTSVMTGETQLLFNALPSVMPLIKDGKLRALGVTTARRVKFLPDVPAVAETVPGYAVTGWLGIGAPKGTPPDIVDRLNREVNSVLADPALLERLVSLGSEPFTGSPADFGKFLAEETEKWAKVVKFANLKVE